jgi:hypothetical protein
MTRLVDDIRFANGSTNIFDKVRGLKEIRVLYDVR